MKKKNVSMNKLQNIGSDITATCIVKCFHQLVNFKGCLTLAKHSGIIINYWNWNSNQFDLTIAYKLHNLE